MLHVCTLQDKGINLTHIESRPSRDNKEEYEFFISVDQACSKVLDEVVDGLRTQISGQVRELSRNKQKDTGETTVWWISHHSLWENKLKAATAFQGQTETQQEIENRMVQNMKNRNRTNAVIVHKCHCGDGWKRPLHSASLMVVSRITLV